MLPVTLMKWCPPNMACRVRFSRCLLGPCPSPRPECVPRVKSGGCPAESPIAGLCVARCDNDADCPGDRKCCGNCPRVCKVPVSTVKNGACPKISQCPDSLPSCPLKPHCGTDRDCPAALKCCGACPRMCIDPVSY
ncbi:perlwapin-like isoform X2 [Haliotis rufescens]|uniref:perlwapin-like isoform X2 n=1 Tax=Haliotis rufescens TaxID=6454 RepID=UPI00201EE04A|nr:perlwapin-like isoform X2 [Haliotis rufescens]